MPNEILAKRLPVQTDTPDERMYSRKTPETYFSIRETLRTNILHLYGEETFKNFRLYEKLKEKTCTLLCDLRFLIRCRNSNVQPTFTKLSYHTRTRGTLAILKKASISLLKEQIRQTRRQISQTERDLYKLHLELSNHIHHLLWNRIDTLCHWRTETINTTKSKKHDKKFQNLQQRSTENQANPPPSNRKIVHNISNYHLSDTENLILSKGFNYAIAPKKIPNEEIITNIEATLTTVATQKAEEIRQDVSRILRTAKAPRPNLSAAELQALKTLNDNKYITILPADKGNATVVMNTEDYINKMKTVLDDPAYKPVPRDPTTYLEKKTKTLINESPMDRETKQKLIPREKSSRCPKLYGLPKIHKADIPMRPIVSAFNSPLQKLEKHLANIMQPSVEKATSYVKNSEHFTHILKTTTIQQNDIIASFDVKSLYPSVPIDEALEQITANEDFPQYVMDLAKHCLKNAYFLFEGQFYRQTEGAAMGSSLSPAVANLYMTYFERKALEEYPLKPKLWIRYVDDIFVVWSFGKEELQKFLTHLNSIHTKIQFTIELEENNQLPFLDVLVTKTREGTLRHTVYRKPTHTNRYLNAESHHHPTQIQAVANTLISRSIRLTDAQGKEQELHNIRTTLKQNGYKNHTIRKALQHQENIQETPEEPTESRPKTILPYIKGTTDQIGRLLRKHNIQTIYKPLQTIGSTIRNPKDKIPLENHGVYSISCGTCDKTYIGQTNRRISARLEEHKLGIRNKETTSALFRHQLDTGHRIDMASCKQIASTDHLKARLIREAIEIEKRGSLNRRDDALNLPTTWKSLIKPLPETSNTTAKEQLVVSATPINTTRGAEPRPANHYNLRQRPRAIKASTAATDFSLRSTTTE